MNKRFRAFGLVSIALAGIVFLGSSHTSQSPEPAYSTEVVIEPAGANAFLLKAIVKDAATGQVLSGPTLKMPAGEEAETETSLGSSSATVTLSAIVDGAKRTATYRVTVKKAEKVLSLHSAKVTL
jgi:hypothetical protein